jgi:RNAse (barnase) inhibitor barstar
MTDSNIATEPEVLNMSMSDVFDWSDDKTIVRDAIWDHMMEGNEHSTDKTVEAMKPFLSMSEADVKDYVEKNLKA